jgi:aminocarboxymuconate-semialdehyde decarboxylase
MFNRRDFLTDFFGATTGLFFVGCMPLEASVSSESNRVGKRREILVHDRRAITVDVHCHCVIDIRDLVKDHYDGRHVSQSYGAFAPDPFVDPSRPMFMDPTSVEARLRYMDERGIDVQAVSLLPGYSYAYWAEEDVARKIVLRQNEQIAELCTAHPDRFVGLGAVAVQHATLAVQQMEYGVKQLGLKGFEIGCSVNGDELSAPKFSPFWAKAEELETFIFLHPDGFPEGERRLQGNGLLANVVGNPLETTVALSHLIFEGVLDHYPRLKICAAHGGGFLASYLGRSNHCAGASPDCKPIKKLPSEYFKNQLYCDSLVFTPEDLRHLLAEVGADHVLLGTDYPASMSGNHMGDDRGADFILGIPGLSDYDRRAILGENAAKLLKIPPLSSRQG